jgi:Ca2+-binding RTX toxin-like protein
MREACGGGRGDHRLSGHRRGGAGAGFLPRRDRDDDGNPGNDVLVGVAGNDVINGLGGNDVIRGRLGNDVICGDLGNDRVSGGTETTRCRAASASTG